MSYLVLDKKHSSLYLLKLHKKYNELFRSAIDQGNDPKNSNAINDIVHAYSLLAVVNILGKFQNTPQIEHADWERIKRQFSSFHDPDLDVFIDNAFVPEVPMVTEVQDLCDDICSSSSSRGPLLYYSSELTMPNASASELAKLVLRNNYDKRM